MEEELEDLIYNILQDSPHPCYSGWYKSEYEDKTVTVFLCNVEVPDDFSDDENETITYTFQFSTFSRDNRQATIQRKYIKDELKKNDFIWTDGNIDYETDTEIYHYADRFIYSVVI